LPEGKKISNLRTRKQLEQQAIDVASAKLSAAVKPVSPADKNNARGN
jgi:hypothetical protein